MSVAQPARIKPSVLAKVGVTTRGDVTKATVRYAREKVVKVYRYTPEEIRSAHVVLTLSGDPARERPALAEVNLEFDGTRVRAQVAAAEMNEAIDLVTDRLQETLVHQRDRAKTRQRWLADQAEHEWRHGMVSSPTLDHFRRPAEEREVVRRKTFALAPMTVAEAAFDMDLLGHEFYLFVDRDSGHDAVVRRTQDGYAVRGDLAPPTDAAVPVSYDGLAPMLSIDEARTRLDLAGEPFVFFVDSDTGRGQVLYLRYDGHYGLIEAAGA